MLSIFTSLLLYASLSSGQVVPYGATPLPYPRTTVPVPGPFPPTTLPPGAFPFGPTPRPLVPGYNNPYYNGAGPAVPILTYSNDQAGDGTYSFSFSTADGKQVQENGYLKDAYIDNAGEPQGTQVVQGSYAYISPDGTPVQVSYIADENGFRPSGVHIPADGKAIPPLPALVDGRRDNKIIDPAYNRFDTLYNRRDSLYNRNDPYNRNRYNYPFNRPYDARYPYEPSRYNNSLNRPYDSKYPYDPARYNNPFNPYRPVTFNKIDKEEDKKETV